MTFTEIVSTIMGDLNLTSTAAQTRIGGWVNRAYRRIASDFSIRTIETQLGIEISTVVGTRELTFSSSTTTPSSNVQKILSFYNPNTNPFTPIIETSVDELRNSPLSTDPVQRYAVLRVGASSVTLMLDCEPASIYTLAADCLVNLTTLSGSNVPAFTEDFHDILIYKGKQLELMKMERYDLAEAQKDEYETRLGEYRLYLALSNHKKIFQGKTTAQGTVVSARI